jgi:hypothetical protein
MSSACSLGLLAEMEDEFAAGVVRLGADGDLARVAAGEVVPAAEVPPLDPAMPEMSA